MEAEAPATTTDGQELTAELVATTVPQALVASVACAFGAVVALTVALTVLFGWAWALLAGVPILAAASFVLAPDND